MCRNLFKTEEALPLRQRRIWRYPRRCANVASGENKLKRSSAALKCCARRCVIDALAQPIRCFF